MRNHKGRSKPDRIQGPVQLEHIEAIEKRLWNAADTLPCLIHQANYLLDQQLRQLEQQCLKEGGFTEKLYRPLPAART